MLWKPTPLFWISLDSFSLEAYLKNDPLKVLAQPQPEFIVNKGIWQTVKWYWIYKAKIKVHKPKSWKSYCIAKEENTKIKKKNPICHCYPCCFLDVFNSYAAKTTNVANQSWILTGEWKSIVKVGKGWRCLIWAPMQYWEVPVSFIKFEKNQWRGLSRVRIWIILCSQIFPGVTWRVAWNEVTDSRQYISGGPGRGYINRRGVSV